MNRQQRLRSLEQKPAPPTGAGGWWCAGGQGLTIGGVRYPRGSHVPSSLVSLLAPNRLAILTSSGFLHHRLDDMPDDLPQPQRVVQDDPKLAAQQRANLAASGHNADQKVGSAGLMPAGHPSAAVRASPFPASRR